MMGDELKSLLNNYKNVFRNEEIFNIISEINKYGNNIYQHNNDRVHLTASGLLYNPDINCVLVLYHHKLQRFLQPGGHVEKEDSSVENAALREIMEETGLTESNLISLMSKDTPINIDMHQIPERGDIKEHKHIDFMFLYSTFVKNVSIQEAESKEYKWQGLESDFGTGNLFNAVKKLRSLLSI